VYSLCYPHLVKRFNKRGPFGPFVKTKYVICSVWYKQKIFIVIVSDCVREKKELNIALIGDDGVGKTAWIGGYENW
jgi:hypothetical protein